MLLLLLLLKYDTRRHNGLLQHPSSLQGSRRAQPLLSAVQALSGLPAPAWSGSRAGGARGQLHHSCTHAQSHVFSPVNSAGTRQEFHLDQLLNILSPSSETRLPKILPAKAPPFLFEPPHPFLPRTHTHRRNPALSSCWQLMDFTLSLFFFNIYCF